MIDYIREADIVCVTKLVCLGRSLKGIMTAIERIHSKGGSDNARWSYKQADGFLFGTAAIYVIAALNKNLIIKNTKEGSERSIANWKHMGKPKTIPDRNREKSVI